MVKSWTRLKIYSAARMSIHLSVSTVMTQNTEYFRLYRNSQYTLWACDATPTSRMVQQWCSGWALGMHLEQVFQGLNLGLSTLILKIGYCLLSSYDKTEMLKPYKILKTAQPKYIHVCLTVCPSLLSVCPPLTKLPVYTSTRIILCPGPCRHLLISGHPSISLFCPCMFVHPSVCLSTHPSIFLSVHPSVRLSTHPSIFLFVYWHKNVSVLAPIH